MDSNQQKTVLLLTIAYFFVELFGGLYYRSLALVTDASFMAINITGQFVAFYVAQLSKRLPTKTNTFGYERAKVISGLFNGILVGFLLFYVFADAYNKIMHPQSLEADKVLIIAVIGLAVNAYGFIMFYRHSADINLKGALLLIANDALGSVGVITSSIIIKFTGLYFLDPFAAVIIGLLVAYPTYFLVKESVHILMEGNPAKIDPAEIERFIRANFPDISSVKDLHIWGLSPEKIILLVRIRTNGTTYDRAGVKQMKQSLLKKYGFSDIYLELYEQKQQKEPAEYLTQDFV
jgi:cobalt-zinc-cadmium efflux system protein